MALVTTVEIRELAANTSAVVAEAANGETVIVTQEGKPVVKMTALSEPRLEALIAAGLARRERGTLADLPKPVPGPPLSEKVIEMRDDQRY